MSAMLETFRQILSTSNTNVVTIEPVYEQVLMKYERII